MTKWFREEIRMKFKLHNIRKSKVWKEAYELGRDESKREMTGMLSAKGMSPPRIADLLNLPLEEVKGITKAAQ